MPAKWHGLVTVLRPTLINSWFGRPWWWPPMSTKPRSPTPLGSRCIQCGEPFVLGDRGVFIVTIAGEGAVHRECVYTYLFPRRERRAAEDEFLHQSTPAD